MGQNKNITESELILLLQSSDRAGYEYLYDHYSAALYKVIKTIIYNDDLADDILQEVFIKVWKNIGQYDSKKGRLFTWMVNISRNLSIDQTRSKGFNNEQKNFSLDLVGSQVRDIQSSGIMPEHIGIMDFVKKLAFNEKLLIELTYFQGYTQSEIALEYGIPLGTVKSRLKSAILRLDGILSDR